MQGLSVITSPQGQPKILTIDVEQHDQQLNPLVAALLTLLEAEQQPPAYEMAATFDEERREFLEASAINLNRAYGDDEPEYTIADLKALNPNFNPL
jgi:hypothetical protein